MNPQKHLGLLPGVVLFFFAMTIVPGCKEQPKKTYEPTFESLDTHSAPMWFRDARFGIFIHWGVYAVPAFHEWYVELMSPRSTWGQTPGGPPYTAAQGDLTDSVFRLETQGSGGVANKYHRENYGVDFEYDSFIPMFKAEHFDPAAWADLFVQAGARYVVMTAKHGDEFAMWPSKFTPRNAMDMGPHRDLAGDLLKAVRSRGLKMGFYHNTTYSFWDNRYPTKGWVDYMNNSIKELVDLYQPDILWGDVTVSPVNDENGKPLNADYWNSKEVIAYFYNHSKNPDEVVTNDRWGNDTAQAGSKSKKSISNSLFAQYAKSWNVENGSLLGDFQTPERRNITRIFDMPWETCDALDPTSWGYNRRTPDEMYMTTNELVDYLSDIVSKGGNLLINIGPKPDGTIPEVMQDRLRGIGAWLSVNGEAIYGTRPWSIYGEGPTNKEVGSWNSLDGKDQFRAGDVRFTRKGNVLYAILLEWPGREITFISLKGLKINKLSLLGSDEIIHWQQINEGLSVSLPLKPVSPYANTLKLECDESGQK
ncbi:MAG: alpha-L-fucosidase [Bacteroidia bacterium]|nr:alpha-L-fucosidase [Bacteroidia bacterium]